MYNFLSVQILQPFCNIFLYQTNNAHSILQKYNYSIHKLVLYSLHLKLHKQIEIPPMNTSKYQVLVG